jgi:diguanylate cyclase (GGDEF)-like protein/PAS domain S-box-containing protein
MLIFISTMALLAGFLIGRARASGRENASVRSQMELWQRSFEKRFYSILEYASIGMASVTLGGRIIEVNYQFSAILDYLKEELESASLEDICHPDDLALNLFNIDRLIKHFTDACQLESRYLTKHGRTVWVLQTISLLVSDQGTPLHLIIQIQDITERKQHEQALRENEYRLRTMLDSVPARISYWNRELRNEFANSGYEEWFGFTPEQMLGRHFREVVGEDRYQANISHIEAVLRGEPQLFEREFTDMRGISHYTQITYHPDISGGQVRGFFAQITDITQRRQAEQELRKSEQLFRNVLENAPIGMALVALDNHFKQVNQAFCRIAGYTWEELMALTTSDITHPDDNKSYQTIVQRLKDGEIDAYEIEKRYLHKDGTIVWVQLTASLLRNESGKPYQIIKQVQDITGRKQLEFDLERQAHTDYLTGLANRRHFLKLAEHEFAHVRRYGGDLAVAMLDLDHFKNINDSYGHQVGDIVLKTLAALCHQMLRNVDVIGRIGGEEFAILFPETDMQEAHEIVERLRIAIANKDVPTAENGAIRFTASIGIATYTPSDADIDILLNRADKALYEAKMTGRNRVAEADSGA